MRTTLIALIATVAMAGGAYAQEPGAGAGRVEVGIFPGGGMFFTQSGEGDIPEFGNYALGAAATLNVNRWIGIEGEGGGTVGIRQNFNVGDVPFTNQRTPSMWAYNGNLVAYPRGSDHAVVPYGTAGVGGLTVCPCRDVDTLGIGAYETFLTGNVGGGLKWFSTRHFGVRADYRLFMVRNKDTAPAFFGNETRYAHRVQAGLVFTF
jgi:hypothetical protein